MGDLAGALLPGVRLAATGLAGGARVGSRRRAHAAQPGIDQRAGAGGSREHCLVPAYRPRCGASSDRTMLPPCGGAGRTPAPGARSRTASDRATVRRGAGPPAGPGSLPGAITALGPARAGRTSRFQTLEKDPAMDEQQRYEAGMKVRREVLGDAHVDRSLEHLTPFNGEFQEMITRHAWGDIWTRPGLPRHTRSLITIAMLIGMNREGELRLHLRAAKNNGVSRDEIKEVLMQSAIYCGIPAANATFHLAEEVWDEMGVESLKASS